MQISLSPDYNIVEEQIKNEDMRKEKNIKQRDTI
jgi:hypothetical protein